MSAVVCWVSRLSRSLQLSHGGIVRLCQTNAGGISLLSRLECLPTTSLFISKRFAGHSKWSNIRHVKGAKDIQRSRVIAGMCMKIGTAIRAGNGQTDPKINSELFRVLEECKANNMPKETITRTIERAKSKPIGLHQFDVKGPGGAFFIIEVCTDSKMKMKNQLQKYFNKVGGFAYTDSGIRNSFDEKGVIEVAKVSTPNEDSPDAVVPPPLSIGAAEDLAIEIGAEEVEEVEEQNLKFICSKNDVNNICKEFARRGYSVKSSDVHMVPKFTTSANEQTTASIAKLYEFLDEDPEINNVFTNVAE